MFSNRFTRLVPVNYPLIQAGMVWTSGWKLASAVSNAGGLGMIGAGSMKPEVLEEHIRKCSQATSGPFGVNLPLLYEGAGAQADVIIANRVPVVITSAGDPARFTALFKEHGITVLHVVSSARFALKAQEAGCDAVIAEGFEAGGHNGRQETTTLVLVPLVREAVHIPVIAAGGIATGRQMLAAMVLGAEGVQIGTRFVASEEASCHINFKKAVVASGEGDTILTLKELTPVRILKNAFFREVETAMKAHASAGELRELLGKGRARKGIFEGDLEAGELEIGQVSALLHGILPAARIVENIWLEFSGALQSPLK